VDEVDGACETVSDGERDDNIDGEVVGEGGLSDGEIDEECSDSER
jgi:hypothetical protein